MNNWDMKNWNTGQRYAFAIGVFVGILIVITALFVLAFLVRAL